MNDCGVWCYFILFLTFSFQQEHLEHHGQWDGVVVGIAREMWNGFEGERNEEAQPNVILEGRKSSKNIGVLACEWKSGWWKHPRFWSGGLMEEQNRKAGIGQMRLWL